MELNQYIRLFRKWLWLIVLMAFVAGGVSFIINTGRPPVYEAQTTISIGRFIEARNPESTDIRIGIELAQTYAELAKTFDVLNGTVEALDLPLTAEQLGGIIDVRILTGTSLMVVSVTYTDAIFAADIANGLAEQLILKSPTNLTREQQAQIDFANEQITALNEQLNDSRLRLDVIDNQLADATTDDERANLTEQRNAIIDQINQASSTVAQFTDTISSLQQNTNALDIVERARIPTSPKGSGIVATTLLGTIVGGAAALGLALLIEYLDETVRTPEEAVETLNIPVLGAIMRFGKKNDKYPDRLVTEMPAMSPVAEGYRTIRTNLLFTSEKRGKNVYVVTSPGPQEGKSITTANLAVTMALAGLQVLLIDCDLRRPRVHEIFGLDNSIGFTTLLSGDPRREDGGKLGPLERGTLPANLLSCLQSTALPKLWVITSGFIPSNPTEVLGSALLQRWIDVFRASSDIDVVLIDTPPCLMAADSSVLAAGAKAEVVLVVDAGHTRRRAALKAKEQFQHLGIEMKGVIVNRISARDQTYEYGYGYGYYYTNEALNKPTGLRRFLGKRQ